MGRRCFLAATALVVCLLCLVVPGCGRGVAEGGGGGKPVAVATIFCYYDILRAVGGDHIRTEILLQPNQSPHEFQASPADKEKVLSAGLIVKNGLGIDDWVDRLASDGHARMVEIGKDAAVLHTEEVEWEPASAAKEAPRDSGSANPHIWLDPAVQMKATEVIRAALVELDPAHQADFAANAAAYTAQLQKLDADFRAATATFKHRDFIGFHSAYDYLAHRYGLRQVAALQEVEGSLSPAQIDKVIALIRKDHVPVLFTEDAFPQQSADLIKRETGVELGVLQPLESYPNLNATYDSLMRQNLAELQRTLGR